MVLVSEKAEILKGMGDSDTKGEDLKEIHCLMRTGRCRFNYHFAVITNFEILDVCEFHKEL